MIIGQPEQFAVEFGISEAVERLSIRAIGFFVVHISGTEYGVRAPRSTALACSFDEIESRTAQRGSHTAPFVGEPNAGRIAEAVMTAVYGAVGRETYLGLPAERFCGLLYSNHLFWAPDGDQAFDDGSYVLQFDEGDRVRLIGFRSSAAGPYEPSTLRDRWLSQETVYNILLQCQSAFERERTRLLMAERGQTQVGSGDEAAGGIRD